MADCPRNFSREEIVAGLKAGRRLMQDRRDAPEWDDLMLLCLLLPRRRIAGSRTLIPSLKRPLDSVEDEGFALSVVWDLRGHARPFFGTLRHNA